jgi:hypothetical protein
LLICAGQASAAPTCATTIDELRAMLGNQAFPLIWEETTMRDGKPLVVSILEKNGALLMEFTKTSEGLWAESAGIICQAGHELEIRFAGDQARLGPAAGWPLRLALRNGGRFTLSQIGGDRLGIATTGWHGTFSPKGR